MNAWLFWAILALSFLGYVILGATRVTDYPLIAEVWGSRHVFNALFSAGVSTILVLHIDNAILRPYEE